MSKRNLAKELADWESNHPEQFSVMPQSKKVWHATMTGPENTPWSNGTFELVFEFGTNYPFHPPKTHMKTKIFHHCFTKKTGRPCIPQLDMEWSNDSTILDILIEVESVLKDPGCCEAMQQEIYDLYWDDRDKFNKTAAEWSIKFANGDGGGYVDPKKFLEQSKNNNNNNKGNNNGNGNGNGNNNSDNKNSDGKEAEEEEAATFDIDGPSDDEQKNANDNVDVNVNNTNDESKIDESKIDENKTDNSTNNNGNTQNSNDNTENKTENETENNTNEAQIDAEG